MSMVPTLWANVNHIAPQQGSFELFMWLKVSIYFRRFLFRNDKIFIESFLCRPCLLPVSIRMLIQQKWLIVRGRDINILTRWIMREFGWKNIYDSLTNTTERSLSFMKNKMKGDVSVFKKIIFIFRVKHVNN